MWEPPAHSTHLATSLEGFDSNSDVLGAYALDAFGLRTGTDSTNDFTKCGSLGDLDFAAVVIQWLLLLCYELAMFLYRVVQAFFVKPPVTVHDFSSL